MRLENENVRNWSSLLRTTSLFANRIDGFVERSANNLNTVRSHKRRNAIQIFPMVRREPFHQGAAGVERNPQVAILLEDVQER